MRHISSQSDVSIPEFLLADKILHAGAFFILGFLWARAMYQLFQGLNIWQLVGVAIWGCFLYALIEEFVIQAATQGRFPSGWDVVADVIGGAIGGLCYWSVSGMSLGAKYRGGHRRRT